MKVKPAYMPIIAFALAGVVLAAGVALWNHPWKFDETPAQGGGGAVAVEFDKKLAAEGKTLSTSNGCTSCHTINGASGAGPTWQGLWGAKGVAFAGTVDVAYVEKVLKTPPAAMASFKGKFDKEQSDAIAEYIKSLSK
jgi:cytochrome c oxidase subunit 2